jgi:hypothetical protein
MTHLQQGTKTECLCVEGAVNVQLYCWLLRASDQFAHVNEQQGRGPV